MSVFDWAELTGNRGLRSRSISAENLDGRKGGGGREASLLGPGRKGRAYLPLSAGQTLTLADIEGPGSIRHVWITVPETTAAGPYVLRDLVLRMYWDDSPVPAVEAPLGDFFCCGFGTRTLLTSAPVVVAPTGGMNSWFRMPFHRRARVTLSSEHPGDIDAVFFQVDYTLDDDVSADTARFHAAFRRTRTGSLGDDHVILDGVRGSGAYVGTFIALTALERFWWGEGQVKFFLDGDDTLATIVGTGLEDYVGGAWAFQDALVRDREPVVTTYSAPFCGYHQRVTRDSSGRAPYATPMPPGHGMYRWHLPDPVFFQEDIKVTLQMIGHDGTVLFERADDISTVAYWYQSGGATSMTTLPSVAERRPR